MLHIHRDLSFYDRRVSKTGGETIIQQSHKIKLLKQNYFLEKEIYLEIHSVNLKSERLQYNCPKPSKDQKSTNSGKCLV